MERKIMRILFQRLRRTKCSYQNLFLFKKCHDTEAELLGLPMEEKRFIVRTTEKLITTQCRRLPNWKVPGFDGSKDIGSKTYAYSTTNRQNVHQ